MVYTGGSKHCIESAMNVWNYGPPRRPPFVELFKPMIVFGISCSFNTIARGFLALATALCLFCFGGTSTIQAQETFDTITVPNYWDPKRRAERPPVGSVRALRFVTTDDFPPFNFLDSEGRLTGFNIDLARAICVELEISCTIQARPFDSLIDSVLGEHADAAIAGIAISESMRSALDFSDVYLKSPARFVARRDAPEIRFTSNGLKGKTLAVVARTAHEAYLSAFFPEVKRRLFPTADAARTAVKEGAVDAHFGDGLQLSFWLQGELAAGCCAFTGGPYLEARFFGRGLTVVVPRGEYDTRAAINSALKSIYTKGVYAELYLRYFPVGFY